MNKNDIITLFRYHYWATDRLLAACDQLPPEAFTRAVTPDPGWGSLRGILVHALDAEYGWRTVLQGEASDSILDAADFADVAALTARWQVEKAAWLDFLAAVSAERLQMAYDDSVPGSPRVWQMMLHVVMHGMQHRSEAAAVLTGYGRSPGELDVDLFWLENPEPG